MYYFLLILSLFFLAPCVSQEESATKSHTATLYNSLDPYSLTQQLAFYELYKDSPEGKEALSHVWKLLTQESPKEEVSFLSFPSININAIVSLITRQTFDPPTLLGEEELSLIEKISSSLANRRLKGAHIWTVQEVEALPPEEIDLSRGLLICQYENDENAKDAIRQYEASLDLMALQILIRLQGDKTPEKIIKEMNRLIFHEMQFRFPPQSLQHKEIDLYTFLPSVLDSRRGVCLGVSIIYLSLAQRLNLPLEIITPPGHIYVRYRDQDKIINIETTARGINLPSEVYLGVNTRHLQENNMKEVIGMAFFNHAGLAWSNKEYGLAVQLYEKAQHFLNDPLLKMLLGMNYLFVGKKTEGEKLLREIEYVTFDDAVSPESLAHDYLSGKVDAEGLKMAFLRVDEKRESILEKQKCLQKILAKYPQFRAGLFQLATTWLQLGRTQEAMQVLEAYHKIDPSYCVVEYYLSIFALQRYDYKKAWKHLKQAEKLTEQRQHHPKALLSLRNSLKMVYPEEI